MAYPELQPNTMAFTPTLFCLVLLHLILQFSLSSTAPSGPDTVCSHTPFPSFCKSILSKTKPGTIHDYGRFSVGQSLSNANGFHSLVKQHLRPSKKTSMSRSTLYALEDCQFLANLNIKFLSRASSVIRPSDTLNKDDTDQAQTMLSATLTNLDTCSDGLQVALSESSTAQEDLSTQLSNSSKLFSVSLALFTHGWVPKSSKGRSLYSGVLENYNFLYNRKVNPNGHWPLKFEQLTRNEIGYGNNGRKLLQLGDMGIVVNKMVVVNPDGSGNFTTINDAVAAAPNNTKVNTGYFGIYVVAGVYEEYVTIPTNKKYLLMVGDGINQTILTGNRSVDGGWTTFNSATLAVSATGFVAVNMTIRNTAGAIMHQAVALRSGSDLSAFYKCSFEGYQDTLYTHSMRQFFRECDIYGTVDFIFGNAAVVLQGCNIYPRQPLQGQFNAITAQGRTDPNQNTGTSIHDCNIQAANDLASSNYTVQTYLGRPWKEYSKTVYMQSFMDSFVHPAGWREWSGAFALDTLYYAEYHNTGPGSDTTNRVTWSGYHVINESDASNFTVSNFLLGDYWLPSTGVPYTGGLL